MATWMAAYFEFEVTTMASSQKVQRRDLASFLNFMLAEVGNDNLPNWTPRLSQAFKTWLQNETLGENTRRWNDRTVNRVLAHLKTFARWVNKHRHFPLGNPMAKIKLVATTSLLSVDRAITSTERRRLLDAADSWWRLVAAPKDRHLHRDTRRSRTRSRVSAPARLNTA